MEDRRGAVIPLIGTIFSKNGYITMESAIQKGVIQFA
jgi:hypothetical protein